MKYSWLILLLSFGCSVRVIQFVNTDAPFRSFNDYILIGMKGKNLGNVDGDMDIRPRIESAIHSEMNRRKYAENPKEPDLIVRYELVSGTVTQRNNTNMMGYMPSITPMYYYNTAIESVLLIEILNEKNQKLVWQASVDLKDFSKKNKRKDLLTAAIKKMYDTYLYEAGKNEPNTELLNHP